MDGGDAATLLDDEAKISPKPKRRATATRRAPAQASNVMYLPAARKPRAKAAAPPVAPVPMRPPVEAPELVDLEPVPETLPPAKTAACPVPPVAETDVIYLPGPVPKAPLEGPAARPVSAKQSPGTGNLDDDYPFDDDPFDSLPKAPLKGPSPRKRDAAGRFVSSDGTPSRKRPQRQAAPVFQPAAQTILPPPVIEAAPTPLPMETVPPVQAARPVPPVMRQAPQPETRRPIDWVNVLMKIGEGFLWCSVIFVWGGIIAGCTALTHEIAFNHYYPDGEPFWHWIVSCIAALLLLPFVAMAGLVRMDAQITGAIGNPHSPLGNIMRGGAAPDQQYGSTQNGNSQFALYSGVQRSGIWQP